MRVRLRLLALASLVSVLPCQRLVAQQDVADVTSQLLRADKDENKRYFLVGPRKGVRAPKKGYGLLVVLPGENGSANFHHVRQIADVLTSIDTLPIINRTYDFYKQIVDITGHMEKRWRFSLGQSLEERARLPL